MNVCPECKGDNTEQLTIGNILYPELVKCRHCGSWVDMEEEDEQDR